MIDFPLARFLVILREFRDMRDSASCVIPQTATIPSSDKPLLDSRLGDFANLGSALGLHVSVQAAARFLQRLNTDELGLPAYGETYSTLIDILKRTEDEIAGKRFFFLPFENVTLFTGTHPFGEDVSKKFTNATLDIGEAAKCLALCRWTAAVFHLMRAMEVGVQHFAKRLRITLKDTETWGEILNLVDAALRNKGSKTKAAMTRHRINSDLAAYLRHVKDAVRNETMHPKATYNEEEATETYSATRAFMRKLAQVI